MAKKKIDGAAPVASETAVSRAVSPKEGEDLKSKMANTRNLPSFTTALAERDLNILIEAQRIRRDPARFMAAKALPQAQRHYIV